MVDEAGKGLLSALHPQQLDLLRLVAREAETLGLPLYAVGGLPRDLMLGVPPNDLDLVVEGDAIRLARALSASHGGSVTVHRRFGTATWHHALAPSAVMAPDAIPVREFGLDLITARAETYPRPAQLPQIRPGTIEDDLHRRDFTINAVAIRLDGRRFGRVLDPTKGIDDLRHKRIRVLHDRSFVDDPTRMCRAIRYEKRLGFRLQRHTREIMRFGSRWFAAVSGERLRHELDLILAENRPAPMLRRLSQLGLLSRIHRSLPADASALRRLDKLSSPNREGRLEKSDSGSLESRWTLWLLALGPVALRSVGRRLAFDRKRMESLLAAADLYRSASRWGLWPPSRLADQLDRLPEQAIRTVEGALPVGRRRSALQDYLRAWRHMRTITTGGDLQRLGLKPGPRYRSILQSLRHAWIDGKVHDAQGESRLLEGLMKGAATRTRPRRTKNPTRSTRKR